MTDNFLPIDTRALTESEAHRLLAQLKGELLDIEVQLGDETKKPHEDEPDRLRDWMAWRNRAKRAHTFKRKQLLAIKEHLHTIATRVHESIHATKGDYDPDSPRDLLAVALDVIQQLSMSVYGHGGKPSDEIQTIVSDLRNYLGRHAATPQRKAS